MKNYEIIVDSNSIVENETALTVAEPVSERGRNNSEEWPFWYGGGWGGGSESGQPVTRDTALLLAPVYQAVSMISADVSKLPLNLYKGDEDGSQEIAKRHPAQRLVNVEANSQMGARQFWRQMMGDALLFNNCYALIIRGGDGRPQELLPLLPDRTYRDRSPSTRQTYYCTEIDGTMGYFDPFDILHISGLMLTNSSGREVESLHYVREVIGLALAAQQFESKYFRNGMRASAVLKLPPSQDPVAQQAEADKWRRKYENASGWFRTVILDDRYTFEQIKGDSNRDSQTHELRQDQVREIARLFNLPPSKLGLSDAVSYNSKYEDDKSYYQTTLSSWLDGIADECRLKLLLPGERRSTYEFRHDARSLLRLDPLKNAQALEISVNQNRGGWMLKSEARAFLDMPPVDGIDDPPEPAIAQAPVGEGDQEEDQEPEKKPRRGRNHARDKWLAEKRDAHTYPQLVRMLAEISSKKHWTPLTTTRGVIEAIKRHRARYE